MSRMISFRNQRVFWTGLIFLIVFAFTTGVLWSHLDLVMSDEDYRKLARVGLFLLPAVALLMTIWELFVDDDKAMRVHKSHPTVIRLKTWCFYGSLALAICEVVHAGGILTYDQSATEQQRTIASVAEGQALIAGATTEAAIKTSSEEARKFNGVGQRNAASQTIKSGTQIASSATANGQKTVAEAAEKVQPSTFLPDWYRKGGMFVALPALALVCFGITMIFARAAAPYVDKDDDGIPDHQQGGASRRVGFTPPSPKDAPLPSAAKAGAQDQ